MNKWMILLAVVALSVVSFIRATQTKTQPPPVNTPQTAPEPAGVPLPSEATWYSEISHQTPDDTPETPTALPEKSAEARIAEEEAYKAQVKKSQKKTISDLTRQFESVSRNWK